MRGRFITVEGVEGAGKSTQLRVVAQVLEDAGIESVMTREPGGTALAEKIRALLLDRADESLSDQSELLLMFAARSQHLRHRILPALEQGRWVLCDRFTDASYAYQGAGRGLDTEAVAWLERFVQAGVRPDLTLLLDLDPRQGLERARRLAGDAVDRFEAEDVAFFSRVRDGYLARARAEPDRFRILDAGADEATVAEAIREALHAYLAELDG